MSKLNYKTKHAKFSKKKRTFLHTDTHTYVCVSGGKKCSFFGKFGVICFLVTSVLRLTLLTYYRRLTEDRTCYMTISEIRIMLKIQNLTGI